MKEKILNRLRRQCSRREYCSSDILKKAAEALEGDREGAKEILDVLVSEKYVDDFRYASAYAREKAMISGWGEAKIRYVLSGKGIEHELIARALEEVDDDKAEARLERLLDNRYRALKDDPQVRMKLLRFALGRGYKYDEVASAMERYNKEDEWIQIPHDGGNSDA